MPRKFWSKSQPETQIKAATAEEWAYMNPVLNEGEPGYVLDTEEFKVGNGVDTFDVLTSVSGGSTPAPSNDVIVVVPHGDDADFARPEGALVVYWLGAVEPTNALDEDLWSGDGNVEVQ
jgi:hypothetical protein